VPKIKPTTPPPRRLLLEEIIAAADTELTKLVADLQLRTEHVYSFDSSLSPRQQLLAKTFFLQFDAHDNLFSCHLGSALKDVPKMHLDILEDKKFVNVYSMPRPTTPDNRAIIKEQLDEMLQANIIRLSQHPRYYSQVHMVKYANKKPRFTIGSFSTFLLFITTIFYFSDHPSQTEVPVACAKHDSHGRTLKSTPSDAKRPPGHTSTSARAKVLLMPVQDALNSHRMPA
jgi:hypothetical protein